MFILSNVLSYYAFLMKALYVSVIERKGERCKLVIKKKKKKKRRESK